MTKRNQINPTTFSVIVHDLIRYQVTGAVFMQCYYGTFTEKMYDTLVTSLREKVQFEMEIYHD